MITNDVNENRLIIDEFPIQYEPKCPVVYVVDRSGSMSGDPINELNIGLKTFQQEIQNDSIALDRLEVAIVSFGSDTTTEREFALCDNGVFPEIQISGSTKLVDGVREGMRLISDRKQYYKSTGQTYYRPYIVLITDGGPDGDQDVEGLSHELRSATENRELVFWPIAVQGADMNMLQRISCQHVKGNLPPMPLKGNEFVKLFKWFSTSFTKISNSREGESVDITPKDGENPFMFTV